MPSIVRFFAVSVSLALCFHAATAEAARRHRADAARERSADAERNLPVRIYRLDYVKNTDIVAIVKTLLSTNGVIRESSEKELGGASDVAAARGTVGGKTVEGTRLGRDILIVQDDEETLRKIDRLIAQLDVKPPEVLIEAQLIRVALNRDYAHTGVNFAFLADPKKKPPMDAGNGKINGAAVQFRPVSAMAESERTANATPAFSNGVHVGFIGNNTAGFVRGLERFGRPAVLAAPRLLVLDKHSADVLLGHQLAYQMPVVTSTGTIEKTVLINIGTELHVRPFVSSDHMIRTEVQFQRTTGGFDSQGIPQTECEQVQTNVMVPDGTTVVACGSVRAVSVRLFDLFPTFRWIPYVNRLLGDVKWSTGNEQLVVLLSARVYGSKTDFASPQPQSLAAAR